MCIKIISLNQNAGIYKLLNNSIEAVNGNGIAANAAFGVQAIGNSIKLSGNTNNGIELTGCDGSIVSCNNIAGRYPLVGYNNRGIYGSMNNNSFINCNFTDSTKTGIYFSSTNLGTKLRGNEMKRHNIGLYLDNTAVIDTQSHAGNRWTGNYTSTYGAWNQNWQPTANLSKSLFVVDPTLGAVFNPTIPLVGAGGVPDDNGWFFPDTGLTYSCNGLITCMDDMEDRVIGDESLREAIARDSVITMEFIPESKMIAQMSLFKELKEDSILEASSLVYQYFVNDKENKSIGNLFKSNKTLQELYLFSLQQQLTLNLTDSLIKIHLNEISLLDSIAEADSSINNLQIRENLIANLKLKLTVKENIVNQIQPDNFNKINEASSYNALVVSTDLPDENLKQLNNIKFLYLKHGIDTINSCYPQLISIAQQCPPSGGLAVYMARSLISLFNDTIIYDDEATCLSQGYYRLLQRTNSIIPTTDISVIPNPSSNYTEVILNNHLEGICMITIKSVLSDVMFNQAFDCRNKNIRINTSSFSQGVYNIQVLINGKLLKSAKLVIVK